MRIVLLGPPGVGKGTQGRLLAQFRGRVLISTGEMLRDAVVRHTPLGKKVESLMDQGSLVPDDLMIELVRERTLEEDARQGFVLDGFPRTVPQAVALEAILADRSQEVDMAVLLSAPDEEIVRRLSSRWECPECRRVFNSLTAPSEDGRHCDDHPTAELRQRGDDTEETVRKRLQVYRDQTAPLVDHYRQLGILKEVQSTGAPEAVQIALLRALEG